jgi:hypothetical protein
MAFKGFLSKQQQGDHLLKTPTCDTVHLLPLTSHPSSTSPHSSSLPSSVTFNNPTVSHISGDPDKPCNFWYITPCIWWPLTKHATFWYNIPHNWWTPDEARHIYWWPEVRHDSWLALTYSAQWSQQTNMDPLQIAAKYHAQSVHHQQEWRQPMCISGQPAAPDRLTHQQLHQNTPALSRQPAAPMD